MYALLLVIFIVFSILDQDFAKIASDTFKSRHFLLRQFYAF